jgi:hypothetical protein
VPTELRPAAAESRWITWAAGRAARKSLQDLT